MSLQQCPVCRGSAFEVCAVNPAHTINCGSSVFTKRITNAICTGCGQVQNVPILTDAELEEIYEAMTRNVQDGVLTDYASLPIERAQHAFVFDCLELPPKARILDIGCSLGGFLDLFRQAGARVVGCEPSVADGKVAKERGIKIVPRMFNASDYETGSFDLIALRFVFEHLKDPAVMLRDLRGLLSPNGAVFIEVPDLAHPFVGLDDFFSFGHTFTFSRETLRQCAEQCGYRIVALKESDNSDLPRRTFPSLRMIATPDAEIPPLMSYLDCSRRLVKAYAEARETLIQRIGGNLEEAGVKSARLVIYGAGTHTAELLQRFPWLMDQCVAFVDGNRDLQGHSYFGRPVLSPLHLGELVPDRIVISAREAETEISTFLDSMGMEGLAVRLYGEVSGLSPLTPVARR
jgi:2-polyprenyl-3-methyl-5-hydroxy-6-metoxy-1,4-benzoquinol methylase